MSLFVIGDLHLSLSADKPMDIFSGWNDYMSRLENNWQCLVSPDDTVVIPGDISWAMDLESAVKDFKFIDRLNGRKIILKGNHDYWWSTVSKTDRFLSDNGIDSISVLNNNHYRYNNVGICGTRGWINDGSEAADAKVIKREAMRLERSIQSALADKLEPIVFLHYPPVFANVNNPDILDVMHRYNIGWCFYGHLHGPSCSLAVNEKRYGINFRLVSSDFLQFKPLNITEIVQSAKK